jgi:hypothetical protein
MNQFQVPVQLGGLPVHLVSIVADNVGYVAFQKNGGDFKAIVCPPAIEGGIEVTFDSEGFAVNGVGYLHNVGYKLEEHLDIRSWLICQQLENPLPKPEIQEENNG